MYMILNMVLELFGASRKKKQYCRLVENSL